MREYGTGRVKFLGTSYKVDRATGRLIIDEETFVKDEYCKLFHANIECSCKGIPVKKYN